MAVEEMAMQVVAGGLGPSVQECCLRLGAAGAGVLAGAMAAVGQGQALAVVEATWQALEAVASSRISGVALWSPAGTVHCTAGHRQMGTGAGGSAAVLAQSLDASAQGCRWWLVREARGKGSAVLWAGCGGSARGTGLVGLEVGELDTMAPDDELVAWVALLAQTLGAAWTSSPGMAGWRVEAEENRYFRARERRHYLFKNLICESAAMREVYDRLHDLSSSDTPVLLTGEMGTGKELLARALHHLGPRAESMLISVNCGQLSEELADFEMFGCVESELLGAVAPRTGIFELAQGGSVFLDEIELLSPMMQGKLARVIREREFRRAGDSARVRPLTARLIASTHGDLKRQVAAGRLRRELFEALEGHRLEVPPLRERLEDILPLARTFLKRYAERHGAACRTIAPDLAGWMLSYGWPGNVRELQVFLEAGVMRAHHSPSLGLDELSITKS